MRRPVLRVRIGEPSGEFQLHREDERTPGSLGILIASPSGLATDVSKVLRTLHDPHGPLELDRRMATAAGRAGMATAFLAGQGNRVWAYPAPAFRMVLKGAGQEVPLDDPQVLSLKPDEELELRVARGGKVLGAVRSEPIAASPLDASGPPRRRAALLAGASGRVSRRFAGIIGGVAGLALLVGAFLAVWPRIEPAFLTPNAEELENRVLGFVAGSVSSPANGLPEAEDDARQAPSSQEEAAAIVPPNPPAAVPPGPEEAADPGAGEWVFRTRGAISSSPCVWDGGVLFGSRDSTLYYLDAATGALRWKLSAGSGIGSSPRTTDQADGLVLVGTYSGEVLAVDPVLGELRWKARTSGRIVSSPCVVEGSVIIGSYDQSVYCFDLADGTRRWRTRTQGRVRATPEVCGSGRVAVGSADGTVYCLRETDGAVVWKRPTPASVLASLAWNPDNNALVVCSNDGTVACLNAADGSPLWDRRLEPDLNAQPVFAGRTVLVGTGEGRLHALALENGESLWTAEGRRGFDARPLVVGAHIVAPTYDGAVHVLNLADGSAAAVHELPGEVYSSPAVDGDRIFVGTLSGSFHALALP
ncbi:MAG: PQQ-binding-like beta-propeller repeat protein [Gemmatimonadota bacterium]|nr:PQQ-binding-like beta-propeller repeat protein [Gemmatimonadota bacterium]MDP6801923.1 PQQ-binding-like beta-propeller repeat protein [Gemmatimonadota bacterium]MDP7032344.1 PQQ-binding-like beta-propeller repeat protein [Gemmatimonadota bacterium]